MGWVGGNMKEKYHYVFGGDGSEKKSSNSMTWVITLIMMVMMIVMGVIVGLIYRDNVEMNHRLNVLEGEVLVLRDMLHQETILEFDRERRDALYPNQYNAESPIKENFSEYSEDGIPVVKRKYNGFKKDRTGFRVYNAWYQHRRENKIKNDPRVVVRHPTDAPIRPHHRKSASWVGGSDDDDDDDFFDFGNSMYSDSADSRAKTINSISFTRNRAKITNAQDYRNENRASVPTTLPPPTTTTTTTQAPETTGSAAGLNDHMRNKMTQRRTSSSSSSSKSGHNRGARNRMGLRSGGSATDGRYSKHVTAIHLEGDTSGVSGGDSGGRVMLSDGVFRDWSVARWARRMKMDRRIQVRDGQLTVGAPGIYFIYAQINYLDNHDVNAFQIMVNNSPWLMCTTMTHTPSPTTKANTCYTGGVRFLEQGDTILIKNTDTNRFAVMLPSHSFFGLVQMSEMGL